MLNDCLGDSGHAQPPLSHYTLALWLSKSHNMSKVFSKSAKALLLLLLWLLERLLLDRFEWAWLASGRPI